jgi:hypothetical protein
MPLVHGVHSRVSARQGEPHAQSKTAPVYHAARCGIRSRQRRAGCGLVPLLTIDHAVGALSRRNRGWCSHRTRSRADHRRQHRAGAEQAGRTPAGWKQKPAKVRQKDRDARCRSFFGYKNHVNADAKHKLIRHYAVTDAAVHDSQERSWMGCWTRATPAMMCSLTALIDRPRSSPSSGPVVTTVGFIDAVGAIIRCL